MPDDLEISIGYDNRLDSYSSFFDHAWATKFIDLVEQTLLRHPAFILCRDWKGVALASRMSWLMVNSLEIFQKTVWQYKTPDPKQKMRALIEHVAKDTQIRNLAKERIIEETTKLEKRFDDEMRKNEPAIDRNTIWNEYLQIGEMPWALWASQWQAYSAIYFWYENFLRTAVSVAQSKSDYYPNTTILRNDMSTVFGQTLTEECLIDRPIKIARLARNCIAHNGGEESEKLKAENHSIRVAGGYLQIYPEDVVDLYRRLNVLALKIVDEAKHIPAFQSS